MFLHEFTTAGSITRVTITRDAAGWEVREEREATIVRQRRFTDWHRVERAVRSIELDHEVTAAPAA